MGRRHPLCILPTGDNAINQKPALRSLQQLGYRADVAANGIEAIVKVVTPECASVRPVPTATTARTTGCGPEKSAKRPGGRCEHAFASPGILTMHPLLGHLSAG